MSDEAIIRRYLSAMEASDLQAVLACFADDAIITSPLYGEMAVAPFYKKLFADTTRTEVRVHNIYQSPSKANCWAAHFGYVWERHDQPRLDTELIDLFEFDPATGKIIALRIIIAGLPAPQGR